MPQVRHHPEPGGQSRQKGHIMTTIKMYRYFGVLAHEGRPVYKPYKIKGEIIEEGYIEFDIPHEVYYADDSTPVVSVDGSPVSLAECLRADKKDQPVLYIHEGGQYPQRYSAKWIDKAAYLIRTARLAQGLTQKQLGELVGYTDGRAQVYVAGWEAGTRSVPRDKVRQVAEALGLEPMELI